MFYAACFRQLTMFSSSAPTVASKRGETGPVLVNSGTQGICFVSDIHCSRDEFTPSTLTAELASGREEQIPPFIPLFSSRTGPEVMH